MADWRDDLRSGSFRGVAFFLTSHEYSSGRRKVDHEFPSKEQSNSEDIGRSIRRFRLDMYVLGDDYFEKRDALIEALETEGPGELVHPYLGAKLVQVGGFGVTEDVREGRIARFNVEFVEAGVAKFPEETLDAFSAALSAVNSVLDAAESVVSTAVDVANAPARVIETLTDQIENVADRLQAIVDKVGSVANGVANAAYSIRKLKADAIALANSPALLASRFRDAFALLFDTVTDTKSLARELSGNTSSPFFDEIVGPNTPQNRILKGNSIAFENYVIYLSVATQAQATLQGNFISVQEAIDLRDLLGEQIELQLVRTDDDGLFQDLRDLKSQMIAALPPAQVGELIRYTPVKTLPALVISYQLFGTTEKEQEIIDENNVRHPGFVPEGIEIEVSNG